MHYYTFNSNYYHLWLIHTFDMCISHIQERKKWQTAQARIVGCGEGTVLHKGWGVSVPMRHPSRVTGRLPKECFPLLCPALCLHTCRHEKMVHLPVFSSVVLVFLQSTVQPNISSKVHWHQPVL